MTDEAPAPKPIHIYNIFQAPTVIKEFLVVRDAEGKPVTTPHQVLYFALTSGDTPMPSRLLPMVEVITPNGSEIRIPEVGGYVGWAASTYWAEQKYGAES